MTSPSSSFQLDEPLDAVPDQLFDDTPVLARYPRLREFRAELGNTTLMTAPSPAGGATILGKCEFENPAGSIKDRPAYGMLCRAILEHGDDPEPLKLVDYSGGSLVRAFAHLRRLTDIPMRFVVPSSISDTWRAVIEESGIEVTTVDAATGIMGTIERATEIAAAEPGWTMLHQMRNVANVQMHQFTTGREIVAQLDGRTPTCLVAAVGTGGTLAGTGRALRAAYPDVRIVGNTPREMPYGTEEAPNGLPKFAGSGGLGWKICQPLVAELFPDATHHDVAYDDLLDAMVRFEDETGRRIGTSAAANWLVSWKLAKELTPDDTIVTIFADGGSPEEWQRAYRRRDGKPQVDDA